MQQAAHAGIVFGGLHVKICTSIGNLLRCMCLILVLAPTTAVAQDADDKTSPFEALRWNGDSPEVMLQETWYRPIAIHGVGVNEILAFLAKTQPGRVHKRFGEDLPESSVNIKI